MIRSTTFLLVSVALVVSGCAALQQPVQITERLKDSRFCEIMRNTQTQNLKFTRPEAAALGPAVKRDLAALKAEYGARCEIPITN